jgi:hypothetical protein
MESVVDVIGFGKGIEEQEELSKRARPLRGVNEQKRTYVEDVIIQRHLRRLGEQQVVVSRSTKPVHTRISRETFLPDHQKGKWREIGHELERLRKGETFLIIGHTRVVVRYVGEGGKTELGLGVLDPGGEHPPALILGQTRGKKVGDGSV